MSIRKRAWQTKKGEEKSAWVVDYTDQAGKRRLKTFARKKEADAYHARAAFEIREGIYTPDSASVTVAEAAELWLKTCHSLHLDHEMEAATITAYQQHVRLHIVPLLGNTRLSRLSVPTIRAFKERFGKTVRARW